ncbi:MAG: HNH endonuclease [Steroidobacteraceae bacterium]
MARGHWGPHPNQYGVRPLCERLWDAIAGPWVEGIEWDDCWFFTNSWRSLHGYGRIATDEVRLGRKRRSIQAHTAAFTQLFGPLAPGHYIRHACGRVLCCNPFHLAPGTHLDNARDKWDPEFAWACTPLGQAPRWWTEMDDVAFEIAEEERWGDSFILAAAAP